MEELWMEVLVDGKPTGKKISNFGRMIMKDGREGIPADNGAGYLSFPTYSFKNDKGLWRSKREYIHRLVAQYFIPNPDNLPQVNHKDCDKSNNHVDNLEWCKRGDNIDHAHAMGRMKKRTENADINILSVQQVIDLYTSVKTGEGVSEAARRLGIPRTTASSIMNKRSRSKITNSIDDYLLTTESKDLPTLYDLGFTDKTKLVMAQDRPSSRNTSGVTGVCLCDKYGDQYWTATWKLPNGVTKSKVFSLNKYGDEAFKMACEHRQKMMEEYYGN